MGEGGRRWEKVGEGGRKWEKVGEGGRRWEKVGTMLLKKLRISAFDEVVNMIYIHFL